MKLYSTNNRSKEFTLREAVLSGLAPDGGLFMPKHLPLLPPLFFDQLPYYSFSELCFQTARSIIGSEIPEQALHSIIEKSTYFPSPLITLAENLHVLELWHGPSLAFKDFGAQFMAQLMAFFNREENEALNILVATSGDTGSAIAAGFHQVPGINVIILYPKGKVSPLQEQQLTTFGDNITALEIAGTFDDCQAMVKQAFSDPILSESMRLTSANSINIARLIPQMFYYFEGYRQVPHQNNRPVIYSVPSGNFGNLTAGLLAKKLGLPIHKFLAATNVNDIVPVYLASGQFSPRPSIETLSNAMDVGNPSNFVRILELYGSTWNEISFDIIGSAFSDTETLQAIREVEHKYQYLMDPHGAVGYLGAKRYSSNHPNDNVIILETAHPSKFKSVMDKALSIDLPVHPILKALESRSSNKISLRSEYLPFRQFLLDSY